ncbi:ABC transporter permease [Prosthecomicrobium hirschii]|uniref:ABC transporter permease n=1 Tax=Prosthecodimorpha hirschii TaxID=665126 RepID=UPI002220031A|nr:ABC transporter permease subunit [Prosthecomicrobium hirschii]MCW1841014.1 ABC transporter permease subunit [Prosthecomicrobium hirschii]
MTAPGPVIDDEEGGASRAAGGLPAWLPKVVLPLVLLVVLIGSWEAYVRLNAVPGYLLPSPITVYLATFRDIPSLLPALQTTLTITGVALLIAMVAGVALAIVVVQFRWLDYALAPYMVILQVTPIIAIAPILLIFFETTTTLYSCALLVTFFPILANTTQGLKSVDHNLLDLFKLYRASPGQTLWLLKLPSSLPYLLTGLRIAGGLALIASVVAEFAAGAAGAKGGLAFRILEAQYRMLVPRMFVALLLLALTGVAIYGLTSLITHLALRRWHESAIRRES